MSECDCPEQPVPPEVVVTFDESPGTPCDVPALTTANPRESVAERTTYRGGLRS